MCKRANDLKWRVQFQFSLWFRLFFTCALST